MVLIFDYDGTCHDTIEIYGKALRKVTKWLLNKGYTPARPTDNMTLSRYLGMTVTDMWEDYLPGAPEEILRQAALSVGGSLLESVKNREASLYEGIEELLSDLRSMGHTLLVLSNCTKQYREIHWEVFGLGRYFEKFYASEDYDGIPKEEIFEVLGKEYPGDYCMIGDRLSDMKVGYTHGFTTVACHYGYGTKEELSGAAMHAYSVSELRDILLKL